MSKNEGKIKLMAKPIEATPILKGMDLTEFVNSLSRKDSQASKQRRQSALSLLNKVKK
ncbi:hypothetical protein PaeBR_07780 [Paenibacillus sp. BR2-3]|uniref:hypothetical protein n=1 Tax=Paenibacillus sp. BR2-3 TaxID=3048494 RepID=UPI0039779856